MVKMADRQPTTTHYLDRDVAELLRRVSRLEARVAELEKPKGAAVVWQDWQDRSEPLAAALRLPTVPDAYGR